MRYTSDVNTPLTSLRARDFRRFIPSSSAATLRRVICKGLLPVFRIASCLHIGLMAMQAWAPRRAYVRSRSLGNSTDSVWPGIRRIVSDSPRGGGRERRSLVSKIACFLLL